MKRISAREAADRLGKHEITVQLWCRTKKIPAYKVGRNWEIDWAVLVRHLSLKYGNAPERELAKKSL